MHKRIIQRCVYIASQYHRYNQVIQETQILRAATHTAGTISLFHLFMFSCTHFQGSWMAQEKHRKAVGEYGELRGEEVVDFLHCPCSRQQAAGTSA